MFWNENYRDFVEAIDVWKRRVFGRPEGTDGGVHILYRPCLEPQQWVEIPSIQDYPELTGIGEFMELWNEFVSAADGLKPHMAATEPILTKDGARACLTLSRAINQLRNFVLRLPRAEV